MAQNVPSQHNGSKRTFVLRKTDCDVAGVTRRSVRPTARWKIILVRDVFRCVPKRRRYSTAANIVDGIKVASSTVSDAIDTAREPGMPLDGSSGIVNSSLMLAFLSHPII